MNRNPSNFRWRAMISVFIAVSFLVLLVSGAVLFAAPPGRIANWTGWTVLGLRKGEWEDLHSAFAAVFVVATLIHLLLNWRPMIGYFKRRLTQSIGFRWEWMVALLLGAGVFAATRMALPPVSPLLDWSENLRTSWDQPAARGPIPHAEQLSLSELEAHSGVPVDTAIARLEARGLGSHTPETVLEQIGRDHGLSAQQVYEIIVDRSRRGARQEIIPGIQDARGAGPGAGSGRFTLAQFCVEHNIPIDDALDRLRERGIQADPTQTLRDIAAGAGYGRPSDLLPIIRGSGGSR